MKKEFWRGIRAGFPIGAGYLSVSFSFGLLAVSLGLDISQAVLVSMFCLTSAGQLAGVQIMVNPSQYLTMVLSQLTINLRYSFMGISLSQKLSERFSGIWRWFFGFFITDEIFAVASGEKVVTKRFFAGLCVLPYVGWTLGTLLGAVLGNVLPEVLLSSLCLAIYGMFAAIVVPAVKRESKLFIIVLFAIFLSCFFTYLWPLSLLDGGIRITVCAVASAALGAALFPVECEEEGAV